MLKHKGYIYGLATVISLAACGGGGGSDAPAEQGPGEPVALSSLNALEASAVTMSATTSATTAGSGSLAFSVSVEQRAGDFHIAQMMRFVLQELRPLAQGYEDLAAGVVIPATNVSCSDPELGGISGSITVSGNVASLSSNTPGDTLDSTFYNCVLEPGLAADGRFNMRINSASGDPFLTTPPYTFGATLSFHNFSIIDGDVSYAADGDMSMLITGSVGGLERFEVGGSRIIVTEGASTQESLFDYLIIETSDYANNSYTQEFDAIIDSVLLGGSVHAVTATPLSGIINQNPDSGVILLSGAANSSVRVDAVDSTSVLVSIDADGDNNFETVWSVAWEGLQL